LLLHLAIGVIVFAMAAGFFADMALGQQSTETSTASRPEETKPKTLSADDIAKLRSQAETGDAGAQRNLGKAYEAGNGVPQNDQTALQWLRKAADQGDHSAENDLGTMYRFGEGVPRDKEEAVRWYQKAARGGSDVAMFNLGTCYYNGDGVGTNEFTAYAWFLLAKEAGNAVAEDAVNRSAATMTKNDKAAAFLRIAEIYEKGLELPKDEAQTMRWLRKAAENDSHAKVTLAARLMKGPEGERHYAEAMDLCKAAAVDYPPGLHCVGHMYRLGLGVNKDPAEAVKWYRKAERYDLAATLELAEMYAYGEGTKADRAEAFMLFFEAGQMGGKGAPQNCVALWDRMDKSEQKKTGNKLRQRNFDPEKVIDTLRKVSAAGTR